MSVGEQAHEETFDKVFLADNGFGDFGSKRGEPGGCSLDLLIQRCAHVGKNVGGDARGLKIGEQQEDSNMALHALERGVYAA